MSDAPVPTSCGVQRGFFVLRDCGKPAKAVCSVCQRGVCKEHRRRYRRQTLCVECAAAQRRSDEWPDGDGLDQTTSSPAFSTYYYAFGDGGASGSATSSDSAAFEGGGGDFGGGGAGGSWEPTDGVYAFRDDFYESSTHQPDDFTPVDFAAFDAMAQDDFSDDAGADFFDS